MPFPPEGPAASLRHANARQENRRKAAPRMSRTMTPFLSEVNFHNSTPTTEKVLCFFACRRVWQDGGTEANLATRHRFRDDAHGGRLLRPRELPGGELRRRSRGRRGMVSLGG